MRVGNGVGVNRDTLKTNLLCRTVLLVDGRALDKVECRVAAIDHTAEDRVLTIQRGLLGVGDEELFG